MTQKAEPHESVRIVVTPTDEKWLRKAVDILSGQTASQAVRKAAARELARLVYRAKRERASGSHDS